MLLASCAASHELDPGADGGVPHDVLVPVRRDGGTDAARDAPSGRVPGELGAPCDEGRCDDGLECGSDEARVTILALDGVGRTERLLSDRCTRRCDPLDPTACDGLSCVSSVAFGSGRASVLDAEGRGLCATADGTDAWLWAHPDGTSPPYGASCETAADCAYVPLELEPPFFAEVEVVPGIRCDAGHCAHFHATGPTLGSPCESDLDCATGHFCHGLPGTCVSYDCRTCAMGDGARCETLEPGLDACVAIAP